MWPLSGISDGALIVEQVLYRNFPTKKTQLQTYFPLKKLNCNTTCKSFPHATEWYRNGVGRTNLVLS
jgi:hypothetical protein